MIGTTVENYEILASLGTGGMGEVYRGLDLELDRRVAIKCLRPELAQRTDVVERFRSEARTLARLQHPNIAAVYRFFEHSGQLFLVMEFIEGRTLEDIVREEGPMHPAQAAALLSQAAMGLAFAHDQNVIHRDIKPANLILASSGVIKLMDFGIAHILGSARLTRTGHVVGTLEYMSPEQVRGQAPDIRTDQYSLCAVGYELLTGQVPFRAESDFELMRAHLERRPEPLRSLAPGIPRELETVLLRGLAKDPADRFAGAAELSEALERSGGAAASRSYPATGAGVAPRTRRETLPAGAKLAWRLPLRRWQAAAVLILAGVFAAELVILFRGKEMSPPPEAALNAPQVQPPRSPEPENVAQESRPFKPSVSSRRPSTTGATLVRPGVPSVGAAAERPREVETGAGETSRGDAGATTSVPPESSEEPSGNRKPRSTVINRIQRQLAFNKLFGVVVALEDGAVVTRGYVESVADKDRVRVVVRSLAPTLSHVDRTQVR